jgi:hypothetical protein
MAELYQALLLPKSEVRPRPQAILRGCVVPFLGRQFGSEICRVGKLRGRKHAKMPIHSANPNLRSIASCAEPPHAKNAEMVIPVRPNLIEKVHGLGDVAEVGDAIVRLVAVNVINVPVWPRAMVVQPDKAVLPVQHAKHANLPIAVSHFLMTGNLPYKGSRPLDLPCELPGERMVIEDFANLIGGEHCHLRFLVRACEC